MVVYRIIYRISKSCLTIKLNLSSVLYAVSTLALSTKCQYKMHEMHLYSEEFNDCQTHKNFSSSFSSTHHGAILLT